MRPRVEDMLVFSCFRSGESLFPNHIRDESTARPKGFFESGRSSRGDYPLSKKRIFPEHKFLLSFRTAAMATPALR